MPSRKLHIVPLGRRRLAMKVSECLKLFPRQKRTHVRLSLLRKLETDDGLGFSHLLKFTCTRFCGNSSKFSKKGSHNHNTLELLSTVLGSGSCWIVGWMDGWMVVFAASEWL